MVELFACNVTVEIGYVDPLGESTVAGYLFATKGAEEGAQEQRWVLRKGYMPLPHEGTIVFRTPPERLSFTTLADWQKAVTAGEPGGLWKEGSTYVKVASMSYATIDFAVDAPACPILTLASTHAMKIRKRTESHTGPVQIESRGWTIQCMTADSVEGKTSDEWEWIGKVCGSALSQDANVPTLRYNREHWVTRPGYQPPSPTAAPIRLQDAVPAMTLDEFFRHVWTEGSTFTIASCAYLDGIPADP